MYWTVPVLFVVHILAYIGIFMMHLFACLPREKISRPYLDGQCISKSGSVVASGVTNTTTDAIILILFLYGISQLNMSAKSKGGWALVTAIGTTACVMSGVAIRSGLKLEKDKNFTEAVLPVNIWPLVEITCLFIVACCSTFPRLFRYICGKPTPKRIRHRRTHARWIDTSSVHSNSSEETASKAQIVRPQRSSSNLSTKSEGALSQTSTLCDADRLEKAGVPELPANPPTYRPRTLSTYRPRNFRPASPDLSVRGTPPPTYAGTPPPTYPGSPPTSPPTSYSAFQPTKSPIIQPNSPPQKHEACNSHPVNVVATIPITRDNYRKTKVISPPTSPPTTHADIPRLTVTTVETPPMDTSGFDMSHPISRISHYSCTTAAILEILDENSPTTSPTSLKPNPQSPISPLSPTSPSFYRASIFTNFQVQQATPMSVIPVRQSIIKKPVEVKVAKYKIPAKAVRFGSVEEVC